MESCVYHGWVAHRRAGDVPHAFRFPLAMLYLDLDELDAVFRGRWCWSADRPALAWVRRADHLGQPDVPLGDAVRALVASRTGLRPAGPIRLLTHPRYAGYVFNPLSLFYCFDSTGTRVDAVVADVTNTPWGERHQYVLAAGDTSNGDTIGRHRKAFHVSPFLPMALEYDWRIGRPGASLGVRIAARARGEDAGDAPGPGRPDRAEAAATGAPVFTATLAMRRRPLDARTLAGVLLRFPAQTAQVVAAIYWQAFRLWRRGAPFHAHPGSHAAAGGGR